MPQPDQIRIASLAPSATNILAAIGARNYVVGVSKCCKDVADVRGLPVLGDCWSLDVADVIKLRPTLVIGSVPFKAETVAKLLEQPITFLAQNPRSLRDIYNDIRLFGRITGRVRAADGVVTKMQREFAGIARDAHRRGVRPRVYCEAWSNPRISSPPWVDELITTCGGVPTLPAGQRVSDEQVARANPDVIVLAWAATGERAKAASILRNPAFRNVAAVRNQRVYVVSDELLNTPGPVLVRGARALTRLLKQS